MSIHKEISFEVGIRNELKANGWLYEDKDASGFVRGLCCIQRMCWHGFRKLSRTHGTFWSRIIEPPLRILS